MSRSQCVKKSTILEVYLKGTTEETERMEIETNVNYQETKIVSPRIGPQGNPLELYLKSPQTLESTLFLM